MSLSTGYQRLYPYIYIYIALTPCIHVYAPVTNTMVTSARWRGTERPSQLKTRVSKSDPNWPKPYSGSTSAAAMAAPKNCAKTYTKAVSQ